MLDSFLYNFLIIIIILFLLCVSVEWSLKLLSIIVCTKLCVQLRARFCTLTQLLSVM